MIVFENADSEIPEPTDDKKRKCILKRKTLADWVSEIVNKESLM